MKRGREQLFIYKGFEYRILPRKDTSIYDNLYKEYCLKYIICELPWAFSICFDFPVRGFSLLPGNCIGFDHISHSFANIYTYIWNFNLNLGVDFCKFTTTWVHIFYFILIKLKVVYILFLNVPGSFFIIVFVVT